MVSRQKNLRSPAAEITGLKAIEQNHNMDLNYIFCECNINLKTFDYSRNISIMIYELLPTYNCCTKTCNWISYACYILITILLFLCSWWFIFLLHLNDFMNIRHISRHFTHKNRNCVIYHNFAIYNWCCSCTVTASRQSSV